MDRNRLMKVAAGLAAVVVVALGFFFGVQPQLHSAQTAQASNTTVTAQNATLQGRIAKLKSEYTKIGTLKDQLKSLKSSVPTTSGSGDFINEVNGLASSSGATVTNITLSVAQAYAPPIDTSAPAATATGTATSSPSSSASATPAPTVAPTAALPASPTVATDPLITAANFSVVPVSLQFEGSYDQAMIFLQGLRNGERLFLLTKFSSDDTSSAPSVDGASASDAATPSWTVSGLIYSLADSKTANGTSTTATGTSTAAGTGTSSTDTAAGK